MKVNHLYIQIGGSSSAKTTIEDEAIIRCPLRRYVTDTTRDIREGEQEGIDYNFVTLEKFKSRVYANVITITDDWLYGAPVQALLDLVASEESSIYSVINIEPALKIKKYVEDNDIPLNVHILYYDIDYDLRMELLLARGDSEESIKIRLAREDKLEDFESMAIENGFSGEDLTPDIVLTDFYKNKDIVLKYIYDSWLEGVEKGMDLVENHSFDYKSPGLEVDEIIEKLEKEKSWK